MQPQRTMLGSTHGSGAAAGSTKRMPDERADREGPSGKRRKKVRADITSPTSAKDADLVLNPVTAEESEVQQCRMLGSSDGEMTGSSTKRMPEDRADSGGPSGKRHKKVRSADPNTSNTSGKSTAQVLDPSAPRKCSKGPKRCEHNRRRRQCKDCGGSSICEHQRRRSTCKDCGGSSLCEHQRVRSNCKDCEETKYKTSEVEKEKK